MGRRNKIKRQHAKEIFLLDQIKGIFLSHVQMKNISFCPFQGLKESYMKAIQQKLAVRNSRVKRHVLKPFHFVKLVFTLLYYVMNFSRDTEAETHHDG